MYVWMDGCMYVCMYVCMYMYIDLILSDNYRLRNLDQVVNPKDARQRRSTALAATPRRSFAVRSASHHDGSLGEFLD